MELVDGVVGAIELVLFWVEVIRSVWLLVEVFVVAGVSGEFDISEMVRITILPDLVDDCAPSSVTKNGALFWSKMALSHSVARSTSATVMPYAKNGDSSATGLFISHLLFVLPLHVSLQG